MKASEPCAFVDNAIVYVLGTLAEDERQTFEEHLDGGCPACAAELASAEQTVARVDAAIFLADGAKAPSSERLDHVRDELFERIAADDPGFSVEAANEAAEPRQIWKDWAAKRSTFAPDIVSQSDDFQPTGFEGVEARPLSVDPDRRYVTMLVRMAPGASYPSHRHEGREECFVVAGDLHVAGQVMHTGDYQVAEAGSIHDEQSTEGGCTLLIVSSQDDELIPA